ncbi:MAG: biotin--[acetyl-CoA-carboxylase] ligase [Planctomycetes bacterium]|nr:biotin--[acetyl-CoA-carboxylase] ligase [Planctomycetota bacterium]
MRSALAVQLRVHHHERVDSTSERLFAALAAGTARHGDVHVACEQTAGRGRRGASWHSAPDGGLYLSLLLLPGAPALNPAALTMSAGLAAFETARELGVATARLKWPNDVVVDRPRSEPAKLAGVLVETRGLDLAAPHYVIGIGLNIAQRAFPPELLATRSVASVALEGGDPSLARAERDLLARLAHALEREALESPELGPRFLAAAQLHSRRVCVELGERELRGRVRALELDRGVLLELDGCSGPLPYEWAPLEHIRQLRPTE